MKLKHHSFFDSYRCFHDSGSFIWSDKYLKKTHIDQIWLDSELHLDLLFSNVLQNTMYGSDYRLLITYFLVDNIFQRPQVAQLSQITMNVSFIIIKPSLKKIGRLLQTLQICSLLN